MKRISILPLLLIPCLLSSCADKLTDDTSDGIMVKTTITKPECSDVKWVGGIAVSLFTDSPEDDIPGGRNLFCSDVNIQSFKGEIADDPQRTAAYAIYPRLTSGGITNIPVSVPTTQEYGRKGKDDILVAVGEAQGNVLMPMEFKPVFCKAVINITNNDEVPDDIISIQMDSKEELFAVTGAISSLKMPQFMAVKKAKSLFCAIGYSVNTDAQTAFTILPGNYSGKEVSVVVTCANESTYTLKTTLPDGFGAEGSVCEIDIDMNVIEPAKPGENDPIKWLQIKTVDELVDGDYIIVALGKSKNGKFPMLGNETLDFTYPEALNDVDNKGKAGIGMTVASEADSLKWMETDASVWTFRSEGNFGDPATTPGWSIVNKGNGKYLSMTNGQKMSFGDTYIPNTEVGGNLNKQRWTIEFKAGGEVLIRSIQNTGRSIRYYAPDDHFLLTGQTTNSTNVALYKLNPDL